MFPNYVATQFSSVYKHAFKLILPEGQFTLFVPLVGKLNRAASFSIHSRSLALVYLLRQSQNVQFLLKYYEEEYYFHLRREVQTNNIFMLII